MARLQSAYHQPRRGALPVAVVSGLCLLALVLWGLRDRDAAPAPVPMGPLAPVAPPPPPAWSLPPLTAAMLKRAAPGPDGTVQLPLVHKGLQRTLTLTLDAPVQSRLQQYLDQTKVPYAAVVLIDVQTGALRAVVETRQAEDPVASVGSLTEPQMPAASIFKVVSTAALLLAGKKPGDRVCFHGGRHGIDVSNLADHPADHRCETLTEALAHSSNAAFAKLAVRDLQAGDLTRAAEALGFGKGFPSDFAVVPSSFDEGTDDLSRGRAAPGFAGSTLSPLHAAYLTAAIANDGKAMRPYVVSGAVETPDQPIAPVVVGQVLPAEVAATLRQMMVATTESGTGRKSFSRRPRALQGMAIAGKTGSLSGRDPAQYRHFSWFVGLAPANKPEVAVAAVAVNGLKWRVKAPTLARDALAAWFDRDRPDAANERGEAPAPVDSDDDDE